MLFQESGLWKQVSWLRTIYVYWIKYIESSLFSREHVRFVNSCHITGDGAK